MQKRTLSHRPSMGAAAMVVTLVYSDRRFAVRVVPSSPRGPGTCHPKGLQRRALSCSSLRLQTLLQFRPG